MSIKLGKSGIVPNWLRGNDWSAERRLKEASQIMAFSPRDWSINCNRGDIPESPDPEIWALWCLITSDTKQEALKMWWDFCDEAAKKNCMIKLGD